jgi:hypothetical protein
MRVSELLFVGAALVVGGTKAIDVPANVPAGGGFSNFGNHVQVTPVYATNKECRNGKSECEWKELQPQMMGTGFILGANANRNDVGKTHEVVFSCIVCGADKLCSDPDNRPKRIQQNLRRAGGLLAHHMRIGKIADDLITQCKAANLPRTLTLKQIRREYKGLDSLTAMPEAVRGNLGVSGEIVEPSDIAMNAFHGNGK